MAGPLKINSSYRDGLLADECGGAGARIFAWNQRRRDSFDKSRASDKALGGAAMADENAPLVLYVEDDLAVLELGVAALEEGGYRVQPVQSAADATRELERPDLVIRALVTDIDLAGGETGWEVAKRARELFPDLAVIYVSGGSSHEWTSRGVPGSVMLTKPFALAQLVVAVSNGTLGPQSDTSTNT